MSKSQFHSVPPNNTDECKLCGRLSALQDSHVIPKAFFRNIKRNGPALQSHDDPSIKNRTTQESWSQRLLCHTCEQKISSWEGYAIDLLRMPHRRKVVITKHSHEWEFRNIDYRSFRLFQVAVLFRSAISSHEAFDHVRFAESDVEKLRHFLNNGEAPGINQFPCLMEELIEEENQKLCEKIIDAPKIYDEENQTYIWYVFGGFNWYFVIPNLSAEELTYQSYVSEAGYMRLPVMYPWQHPWLRASLAHTAVKEFIKPR